MEKAKTMSAAAGAALLLRWEHEECLPSDPRRGPSNAEMALEMTRGTAVDHAGSRVHERQAIGGVAERVAGCSCGCSGLL